MHNRAPEIVLSRPHRHLLGPLYPYTSIYNHLNPSRTFLLLHRHAPHKYYSYKIASFCPSTVTPQASVVVQEVPLPQQLPPDRLGATEGGDSRPQAREGPRGGADRGRGRDRDRDRGRGRGRGREGERTRSRDGSSERSSGGRGTSVGGGAGAEEAGDELTGYAGLSSTATPGRTKVLRGQPYIHDTCGGLTYRISPSSFFQTNTRQAEVLYGIVRQGAALRQGRTDTVLDLYCGTGAIGLSMAAECRQVVGVEVVGAWAAGKRQSTTLKQSASTADAFSVLEFYSGPKVSVEPQNPQQYARSGVRHGSRTSMHTSNPQTPP